MVASAVVLAGCSGAGGSGGDSESTTPDQTVDKFGLTGEPIVIAHVSQATGIPGLDISPMPNAERAAAEYVNSQGGVNGRPIDIVTCDSRFDPAASKACALTVLNSNPVAVTGLDDFSGSSGADALYADKNVVTLNAPSQTTLLNSTNAFPVSNGGVGEMNGLGYYMGAMLKAKQASLLVQDTPAGHQFAEWIEGSGKPAGLDAVNPVYFSNSITDFSAPVANVAAAKPDAVYTMINGSQLPLIWGQLQQQGIKANQIYVHSIAMDSRVFEKAGQAAVGARIISEFASPDDVDNPEVKIYREAMQKAGYDSSARTALGVWGFSNVMFLATAMKAISGPDVNATSLKNHLSTTLAQGSKQTIPVFLASPATAAPSGYLGIHRGGIQILEWNGSKFTTVEPFFTAPVLRADASS